MLHAEEQYLQFYCGSFALLLPLNSMTEIAFYNDELCAPTGNSLLHHGKTTAWRDTVLPYIDLRLALHLPRNCLEKPENILVLCDANNQQPIALAAIDAIVGFVRPPAGAWYHANGINNEIDVFFERLYWEKQHDTIAMCLCHPKQWLHNAIATPVENGILHAH